MTEKKTCPRCFGNGYIKIPAGSTEHQTKEIIAQCSQCNSQGEVEVDEDE